MERDIEKQPYSIAEERVCAFLQEITKGEIGCGDDPIGFLIASYAALSQDRIKLRAEVNQLQAKLHCMCGSPVAGHGMGDGHSPVSMYDYTLEQTESENEHLRSANAAFLSACKAVLHLESSSMGTAYELPRVISHVRDVVAKHGAAE